MAFALGLVTSWSFDDHDSSNGCQLRIKSQGKLLVRCRHSSVDLPAPTILPPWVRVPSIPSTLFSFIIFVLYLSFEKNGNKQKEAGFGPFS